MTAGARRWLFALELGARRIRTRLAPNALVAVGLALGAATVTAVGEQA